MPRPRARRLAALLTLPLLLALASAAPGQGGGADLNQLALEWTRGVYRSPLLCEIEGETRRGLRRILVRPRARPGRSPVNEIAFFDLDVPEGTRCHGDLGGEEPNVVGRLRFALEGRSRPDIARHDFSAALRREGGFTFEVRAGTLRVGPADAAPEALELVDFGGGTAEFRRLEPGSDARRQLRDLGPLRKLHLELRSPDGRELSFDLVQFDER